MTIEQKQFLVNLLGQVTIKAADANARDTVAMIHSILEVLQADEKVMP